MCKLALVVSWGFFVFVMLVLCFASIKKTKFKKLSRHDGYVFVMLFVLLR